jgi:hypothetical protein
MPLTYDLDTETPPSIFWIEGFQLGVAQIVVQLEYESGGELVTQQDTVWVTVAKVDATAYRPQNPYYRPAVPEDQEWRVGIRRNGDDDDGDGRDPADQKKVIIPDRDDGLVDGENDLIETYLTGGVGAAGSMAGTEVIITRSSSEIRLYSLSNKADGDWFVGGSNSFVLPSDGSYWTEYVGVGDASATLTITLRDTVHERDMLSDSLTFTPLNSVVIAIGGRLQAPTDPANAQSGIYDVGRSLIDDGYDAYFFPHSAVAIADGTGPAYDELVNAIQNRGVTDIAIAGYSWGAGGTYLLSYALNNNVTGTETDITKPFSLRLTGYIDGVKYDVIGDSPEKRRPFLTQFHVNQYTSNVYWDSWPYPPKQWGFRGDPPGDDDLDRANLGVDHVTIDDHADVKEFLRMRITQKLPTP